MRRRITVEEKGMAGGGEGRLICAGSGRGREEREIWGEITRGKTTRGSGRVVCKREEKEGCIIS